MENPTLAYHSHFGCPEAGYYVDPADAEVPAGFKSVVPVVLACNENYAPYAAVTIRSVLENVGPGRFTASMSCTRA